MPVLQTLTKSYDCKGSSVKSKCQANVLEPYFATLAPFIPDLVPILIMEKYHASWCCLSIMKPASNQDPLDDGPRTTRLYDRRDNELQIFWRKEPLFHRPRRLNLAGLGMRGRASYLAGARAARYRGAFRPWAGRCGRGRHWGYWKWRHTADGERPNSQRNNHPGRWSWRYCTQ